MSADDLAAELLSTVLEADPLAGSLYGFDGYDDRLPDLSAEGEHEVGAALESIARRAEEHAADGLDETEHQTLDFVRVLARGMADAARVPLTEFTICDTFVAPVPGVLTTLPKLALDTAERREGYLARLAALPALLATAGERHREGSHAGRTAVARLVASAVTQLDLLIDDPELGGAARSEQDDDAFKRAVHEAIDDHVRPALAAYRDGLTTDILPAARDDARPGLCYLPQGDAMYRAMARLHTSTTYSPEELHAVGHEIVGQVRRELAETGPRLWRTSDIAEIFDHLRNDRELRYTSRDEMLEHARQVVAAAERAAPPWFATVPDEPCTVEPVPEVGGGRHGGGVLHTGRHRRVPTRHLLPQHVESGGTAPLRRRGRRLPRGRPGPPLPAHDRHGGDRPGAGPARAARHRLCRGLGPLRRTAGRRDGPLHRRRRPHGPLRGGLVAGQPACGRHRPARLRMEPPAGRRLAPGQHADPAHRDQSETDRYISFPGQALAYMVGRREIVRLRALAADRLGAAFDLREFHDLVLRVGALPLPALARTVERWIERAAA